jgi:hypothetical protein
MVEFLVHNRSEIMVVLLRAEFVSMGWEVGIASLTEPPCEQWAEQLYDDAPDEPLYREQ